MTDWELLNEDIRQLAISLEVGETLRCKCPVCRAEERAFALTRTEAGLLYICPRASCGASGFVGSLVISPHTTITKRKKKSHSFKGELMSLPQDVVDLLINSCGVTKNEIRGFKYSEQQHRYLMPINNRLGYRVGWVSKVIKKRKGELKAISYFDGESSKLHYVRPRKTRGDGKTVYIVENILSAIRVGRYQPAVALLGSHMNMVQAIELNKNFNKLILCLDPDAINKAIKIKQNYSLLFSDIQVIYLTDKPKNLNEDKLLEELELGSFTTKCSNTGTIII